MVRRKEAARRFWHSLVVKEALGTITAREHMLLERYTVLLRKPLRAGERKAMEQMAWQHRTLMKEFGRLMHEAAHSPNGEHSNTPTQRP